MSTQATEGTGTATQETGTETTATTGAEETKPTETVEFWKTKAREQEKRAKDNASAASRLAEIEEAQKSEAQKAADREAAANKRAELAEAKALSLTIATEHKLGTEDAALLAALPDEESMRALAKRLAGQADEQKANANHVSKEGTSTKSAKTSNVRDFARTLFGDAD